MDLTVAVHRDLSSVAALAGEWQALHDASGDVNPFSGPDWALPWLERFGVEAPYTPLVLEVREGERLVGVSPLCRQAVLGGRAHVVQPVGTGAPWIGPYELSALLVDPRVGREAARVVVGAVCGLSAEWDWADLALGTAVPWLVPEWLPDFSFTVSVRRVLANAVLDLSAERNVYAGRRNLKESFRRARNRLTRDFGADGWRVRRVTDQSEVGGAFSRLVALHGDRATLGDGKPVHADVFADGRVRDYLGDVVGRMAARDAVSLYELLIDEEVVATQLVLHTATASYSSVSGLTDRAWDYSAVTYLQSQAVADAQKAGHREFNLSLGPNQAKLRWTDEVRTMPRFSLVAPTRRSQMLYLAAETRGVVAAYREARKAHRH
ncbi:CelD/BcsL family acetyltransferase involved in cellulose biosynthesis [Geodermatophilus normandii]|uniref:CelD/BcsL family acetyltransferase involved in cellulose biosynthesis n=1 Tax=Geodermatophilus normandii TaxID=1137989 RepID=A0A317QJJ7_9ACTN|nr:GNAT family N-acetyltransferase [Geodermatophilus normandii]PWW21800.1 CelD/BcsL family acetyltransferase involved in cellulose biosynthesis [Geodermatophilus normandii]